MRGSGRVSIAATLLLAACAGNDSRAGLGPSTTPTARAAVIAIVSGDDQQANAGERLAKPLIVRVTDAAGNSVGDVTVAFEITGAGGLNGKDAPGPPRVYAQTGATGEAQATLEPYDVGPISVSARVEGAVVPAVTFTADVTVAVVEFRSLRSYGDYAAFYGPCRCVRTVNTITVPVGTAVEWKSIDDEPFTVTSTSIPQGGIAFDSGTLTRHSRFRFVPAAIGTWEYRDTFSGLTATLTTK